MLQRWYFTLVGLLITVTLCGLAAIAVPVKYQAKAQILVLPPHTSVGTGGNPYLALGGLQAASDVLARAMSDGKTFQLLRSEGITGTYTVARDLTTSGPILLVAADDSTPEGALSTLNGILSQAAPRLSALQDDLNVPQNTRLTSNIFTQDQVASVQRKSQIRAVLVGFAGGVFLTIMLVSAADSALTRRRRRRAAGNPEEPGPDHPEQPRGSSRTAEPTRDRRTRSRGRRSADRVAAAADTEQFNEMFREDDRPVGRRTEHAGRRGNG
jgi:hypothetical protein